MSSTALSSLRVPPTVRRILKWGPLYDLLRPPLERVVVGKWQRAGRPVPPPHLVKQAVVRGYQRAFGLNVLVETGTFLGDMVASTRRDFKRIYTIELDEVLCLRARRKFAGFPHIAVIGGDSSRKLPEVLAVVDEPCLFWLDGHYSGGITARGAAETPILQELQCILRHRVRTHVILIDDARCFTGANGYPTIAALRESLAGAYPSWLCTVVDDIIRMHPPTDSGRRLTAATAPASRTCTAEAQAGPRAGTLAQGAAAPRDWAGPTTGAEQTCG